MHLPRERLHRILRPIQFSTRTLQFRLSSIVPLGFLVSSDKHFGVLAKEFSKYLFLLYLNLILFARLKNGLYISFSLVK